MDKKYLELFDPVIVQDLFSIIKSCSDNHKKADMIVEYLKPFKFKEIDLGTNIICLENKKYDDVVFKIALDSYGLEDNFNDIWLSEEIPEYARVYTNHRTGIVSVHKRYKVFKTEQSIQRYHKQIMRLLNRLSKDYLIVDLSPINIKNFGTDKNGELVIIDGSDLIKLNSGVSEFRCTELINKKGSKIKECGGELNYDDIFRYLVCEKCGKQVNPLTLKKLYSKEVNILKAKHFTTGVNQSQKDVLDTFIQKRRTGQENNYMPSVTTILPMPKYVDEKICDDIGCGTGEMKRSETRIDCEIIEYKSRGTSDVSNNDDDNDNEDFTYTRKKLSEKVVKQNTEEEDSDEDNDSEIPSDRIHLMDNGWFVSHIQDDDSNEIDIILSKNKSDSWATIYKIKDSDNAVDITVSSYGNIIYVFVSRDMSNGIVNELTKLDPTKFIPDDIDDEIHQSTNYISDCNDQIQAYISEDDLCIDIAIDGDLSILTRSDIRLRVASTNRQDVEIDMPEIFELVNSKLNN